MLSVLIFGKEEVEEEEEQASRSYRVPATSPKLVSKPRLSNVFSSALSTHTALVVVVVLDSIRLSRRRSSSRGERRGKVDCVTSAAF